MSPSRLVGLILLALGSAIAPGVAGGQTPPVLPRVGIIHHGGATSTVIDGLRQGLRERGLEEGRQLVLDIRETRGDLKAVGNVARDLEQGKAALIYAVNTSVAAAAKRATAHTVIVFFAGADPVAAGLVESFARPGGRLTGVHTQATDVTGKRLEVLKEMIPGLGRVVTCYNPANSVGREGARLGREAARQLGVQFVERHVGSVEEFGLCLSALKPGDVDAYFYTGDAMVLSQAQRIIDAARLRRLPTMFHEEGLVIKGALASYGPNYREAGRLSAKHVQRVLAGTHPKDLPVENYDRIGLALNLRTAREIGLTIPPSVRLRADTVIE